MKQYEYSFNFLISKGETSAINTLELKSNVDKYTTLLHLCQKPKIRNRKDFANLKQQYFYKSGINSKQQTLSLYE